MTRPSGRLRLDSPARVNEPGRTRPGEDESIEELERRNPGGPPSLGRPPGFGSHFHKVEVPDRTVVQAQGLAQQGRREAGGRLLHHHHRPLRVLLDPERRPPVVRVVPGYGHRTDLYSRNLAAPVGPPVLA